VRFAEVDLNENEDMDSDDGGKQKANDSESEEEEEEEGEDDEFIDLLDVLDGKGDIDMGSDDENKQPAASTSKIVESDEDEGMEDENSEEEEDEERDDEEEEENEQMDIVPSDDEDTPGALDQLQDFVSGLDVSAKKRKAPEDGTNETSNTEPRTTRKRRLLTKEKTEAGEENEFRAHTSGMPTSFISSALY